jgi:hypothetical protein
MEKYELNWRSGSRTFLMIVELVDRYGGFETYKIYPREDPNNYVKIRGNRPLLRFKLKLKHKGIHWELVEGKVRHQATFEDICKALSDFLDMPPASKIKAPPPPPSAPSNFEPKYKSGPGKYRSKENDVPAMSMAERAKYNASSEK